MIDDKFKENEEFQTFEEFILEERKAFVRWVRLRRSDAKLSIEDVVKCENIIVAYDQLRQCYEKGKELSGTNIVFQAIIRHNNELINDKLRYVKPGFSLSEETDMMNEADKDEFIRHVQLCNEAESLIRYLVKQNIPVEKITLRNNSVRLKVTSVESQHFPIDKIIVTKYLLQFVF